MVSLRLQKFNYYKLSTYYKLSNVVSLKLQKSNCYKLSTYYKLST